MRQTAAVLLDTADDRLIEEVCNAVEAPGDARVIDLRVWRVGPGAHAAIVSASGQLSQRELRRRVSRISELAHLTVELSSSECVALQSMSR